jgi:hypothetical protein
MLTNLEIILVFAFGLIAQVFWSLTFIIYLQVLEAVGPIVFLSTDTRKLRNEEIILVFAFGLIAQVFWSLTFIIYLQVLEAVGPIIFLSTDTRKLRNEGFLSPYHPRYPDILTNSAHPMVHTVLLKDLDIWVNAKLKFSLKF